MVWRGDTGGFAKRAGLTVVLVVFLYCEVLAKGELSGRIDLTYQNLKNGDAVQELFAQRYQATLRDKVFKTNDLGFTLFYDDFKNLSDNLTVRRYRGEVDLRHRYYRFNARLSPRQKLTPVQLQQAIELSENRFLLDVFPKDLPRVRLSYDRRQQYFAGEQANKIQDLRGEVFYQYRFVSFKLNRFENRAENEFERRTSVTGGAVRLMKSFKNIVTTNAGYEYQLTESRDNVASFRDVTNHNVNAVVTGRYKRLATGTISLQTRWLNTKQAGPVSSTLEFDNRADNHLVLVRFFPQSPAKVDLSRSYQRSEQATFLTLADYYTTQLVVDGKIRKQTTGRLQLTQRFDAGSTNGIVPPDIYFVGLRSRIYKGVDLRAEANVTTRNNPGPNVDKYATSSLIDLFLQPTRNLQLAPSLQYVKFAENIGFTKNDRSTAALTASYYPRNSLNIGGQLARTRISSGRRRIDTSGNVNVGMRLRNRATLTVTYGFNQLDIRDEFMTGVGQLDSESRTLNVQAQIWVNRRGSLSLVYTNVDRQYQEDTNNVALNFRQNF